MGNARFTDDFKRDAVRQITERSYPVAEVSQRLGVSQHSIYEWRKKFSKSAASSDEDGQSTEIRRLKRELTRVVHAGSSGDQCGSASPAGCCLAPEAKEPRAGAFGPGLAVHQHGMGFVPEAPQS